MGTGERTVASRRALSTVNRRPSWTQIRDIISVIGAVVGLVYEATAPNPNPEITIGCFGILLGPAWLAVDRRNRPKESDGNDDQQP